MERKRDITTEFCVPLLSKALKMIEEVLCLSKSDFIFFF